MRIYFSYLSIFFISLISFPSQASIINHGTYWTDSVSGMEWLDFSLTVNRSVNDISSKFGNGAEFDGWRYATVSETGQMLINTTTATRATVSKNTYLEDFPDHSDPAFKTIVDFLGITQIDSNNNSVTWGVVIDPINISVTSNLGHNFFYAVGYKDNTPAQSAFDFNFSQTIDNPIGGIDKNTASSTFGHFLVRDASVPLPTPIFLLIPGFLFLTRRKNFNRECCS